MTLKFRFRKYIDPKTYAEHGIIGIPDTPAFVVSTQYEKYNNISGSGNLATSWHNALVLSAKPTEEVLQDYFKREWVEQDGIDVYAPRERKRKAVANELEMMIFTADRKTTQSVERITKTLNEWGIFEYYDNYHRGLKRLIYEGYTVLHEVSRNGMRGVNFKINCTNVLGYDIKNYNPATGLNLW